MKCLVCKNKEVLKGRKTCSKKCSKEYWRHYRAKNRKEKEKAYRDSAIGKLITKSYRQAVKELILRHRKEFDTIKEGIRNEDRLFQAKR